jgi:hypothetical protein
MSITLRCVIPGVPVDDDGRDRALCHACHACHVPRLPPSLAERSNHCLGHGGSSHRTAHFPSLVKAGCARPSSLPNRVTFGACGWLCFFGDPVSQRAAISAVCSKRCPSRVPCTLQCPLRAAAICRKAWFRLLLEGPVGWRICGGATTARNANDPSSFRSSQPGRPFCRVCGSLCSLDPKVHFGRPWHPQCFPVFICLSVIIWICGPRLVVPTPPRV